MEAILKEVEECKRRISKLEEFREKDLTVTSDTKNDVGRALTKIDDLITVVKELPNNINSSLKKSLEIMEKEHESISKDFTDLKNDYTNLKDDTQKKFDELQNLINERTVDKEAQDYSKIKSVIVTAIITAIVSFILGLVLK